MNHEDPPLERLRQAVQEDNGSYIQGSSDAMEAVLAIWADALLSKPWPEKHKGPAPLRVLYERTRAAREFGREFAQVFPGAKPEAAQPNLVDDEGVMNTPLLRAARLLVSGSHPSKDCAGPYMVPADLWLTLQAEVMESLRQAAARDLANPAQPEAAPAVAQVPTEWREAVNAAREAMRAVRINMKNNAPHLSGKSWGYLDQALERLDALAAAPEAPAQAAPSAGEVERALRRMLCVVACGRTAYMDDGEAQDNSVHPNIDFMRDTPAEIQRKLFDRSAALSQKEQP